MRYIDLMGGQKPHLLVKTVNNLGAETHIHYAPSTKFYLADKLASKPWITRLPFPVHCVEKVSVTDTWRQTTFSTQYTYHHGYFDGTEREFRGFGRVEQVDVETYGEFVRGNETSPYISDDKTLYQPPIKTITWFHTGAFLDRERILSQFQDEYFPNWLDKAGFSIDADYAFAERALPEPDMTHLDLSTSEWREALRACKGMTLRQEVYELDVDALEDGRHVPAKLFTAAGHNCQICRIQPYADNQHAVFLVTESEALTYHYELDLSERTLRPDPRIAHTLVLNTNEYGQPLQQAAVAYPRVRPFTEEASPLPPNTEALIRQVQAELHIGYTETRYTNDVDLEDHYRLRLPFEVSTFEVTGICPQDEDDRTSADPWDDIYFTLEELRRFRLSETYQTEGIDVETIPYHLLPDRISPQKRMVEQVRTLYFNENLVDSLPLGELNHLGLPYETYKLALTDDLLDAILREKLEGLAEDGETYSDTVRRILQLGGYYRWNGQWLARSGIAGFASDATDHFYLPERYTDPFNQVTELTYDPYDIYIRQTADPLGNTTSVEAFDFRVLAPAVIKDPNDNLSAVAFDILGLPAGTAVMGKNGDESGDNLTGFREDLTIDEVSAFFTNDDYNEAQARDWLGQATARFVYCFGEERAEDGSVTYGNHPACACGIVREMHVNQINGDPTPIHTAFEYSDGSGQALVTKTQAEPETEDGPLRWLATGKTILNNKGKPVKQYEPYFSDGGHRFEESREAGVTPVMYYDAVGRLMRTEQPDGAYSRVEFSPWFMTAYDPNDTVLEPDNAWYARNSAPDASSESRRAAELTTDHADTPAVTHLDSLGREVLALAHNRRLDDLDEPVDEKYITFTKLDAEGKPLWLRDARGNRVMQYISPPIPDGETEDPDAGYVPCYDIAGNLLFHHSMDAGDRWMLNDVTGKPLFSWDSRNNILRTSYDPLRRPVTSELRNDDHADWIVVGCMRYGDEQDLPDGWEARNLRGQVYRSYDQSGLVTNVSFDFKGNPLEVHRRIALAYDSDVDWRTAQGLLPEQEPDSLLMDEIFRQISEYDALNRVTLQYQWHQGPGSRVAVVQLRYNQRGLLQREEVVLDAVKTDGDYEGGTPTTMVREVTYNEKGQRLSIEYGNGTTTIYAYDPETFRLIHLETRRHGDNKILQDLGYTYDSVGNITEIVDGAQPTVFFNNFRIDARNRYTYDALYRLIRAEGREHAGQVAHGEYDNWHDCPFRKKYHPNDAMAWRNYTERYTYDAVGNILSVRHTAHGDSANSWTRQYQYERTSNRLLATGIGNAPVEHYVDTPSLDYRYDYNVHGSMIAMPHLRTMEWDFTEHLHHIARTTGTQGDGDGCPDASLEAWYCYDAAKQRTRKRVVKQGGLVEERLYLGGVEIFRKFDGRGTLTLERETLHVMDDQQRIALVETKTVDDGAEVTSLDSVIRFQLNNHLGSSSLELDEGARVISYEEFYPYGSTSYQAVRGDVEVSAKRYRYTGMERDEETGLSYHGARYYSPWVGRWSSIDPTGLIDGTNRYRYARGNPINLADINGMEAARPGLGSVSYPGSTEPVRVATASGRIVHVRPPSTRGEAYSHVRDRSVALAHGIADRYTQSAGEAFVRLITEHVVNESGATFACRPRPPLRYVPIGASAARDESSSLGAFQTNVASWRAMHRRLGEPDWQSSFPHQASPSEEIDVPIRFYGRVFEQVLELGTHGPNTGDTRVEVYAARAALAAHMAPPRVFNDYYHFTRDNQIALSRGGGLEASWTHFASEHRTIAARIDERLGFAGILPGGGTSPSDPALPGLVSESVTVFLEEREAQRGQRLMQEVIARRLRSSPQLQCHVCESEFPPLQLTPSYGVLHNALREGEARHRSLRSLR
jgi:RHS repeat-associated protein